MTRHNLNDLWVFISVAREGNFTRAAARLGVSPSAVSQAIAGLEERLKIRLLTRNTRSVSLTSAGQILFESVLDPLETVSNKLDELAELRERPAGTVRITCGDFVLQDLLLPKLAPVLKQYPDIKIEFDINYGLRDIVADRFDAGVRFNETVEKDMIAIPIGAEQRMAAVASPDYIRQHSVPITPRDLVHHNCINIRMPTYEKLYAWEFEKEGKKLNIHVDGQLIFNTSTHIVAAAVSGLGIAFLPEEEFSPYIEQDKLVKMLEDWCPPFPGYHLYYPSRRQPSAAFSLVINALKI
ncbi:LysR family transcriptional regulator [Zymobacter palmae]|uniref:Transcriptional regulator n=1 Tax=Zymobacter palmae TaxID=33074 RepID=A0A348HIE2_9GAMM|nr:LysR family transcriptional regulator [Zymobacter palmae]BBG31394.1 transcriptional regulator [Zymobacter palmae]